MRIYYGITGTGGQIKGSFEVGEIYLPIGWNGDSLQMASIKNDTAYIYEELDKMIDQGFMQKYNEPQSYAIEIKDFRREDIFIKDLISDTQTWIKRLPQSFQYVHRYYVNCSPCETPTINDLEFDDLAILMPIHQKWFDMIASGEKKYEFRNILPKALR